MFVTERPRTFRNENIAKVVREIQQAGIAVIGNFIFGLPDDTMGHYAVKPSIWRRI